MEWIEKRSDELWVATEDERIQVVRADLVDEGDGFTAQIVSDIPRRIDRLPTYKTLEEAKAAAEQEGQHIREIERR